MSEPKPAGSSPMNVKLTAGKHAWCSCGESASQPFCDGSHKGTDFRPVIIEVDAETDAHLCLCKRTQNAPHCDGSHRGMDA